MKTNEYSYLAFDEIIIIAICSSSASMYLLGITNMYYVQGNYQDVECQYS